MMPPWLLVIKIGGKRRVTLSLPIFLLWPLVGILWILAAIISLIQSRPHNAHRGRWHQILVLLQVVSALSGLLVEVHNSQDDVFIEFI